VYTRTWKFRAAPGREAEFEVVYGSGGDWAQLFSRGAGFLGTELRRTGTAGEYLTIDRWDSSESWEVFRSAFAREYEALDRRYEALTLEEESLSDDRWEAGSTYEAFMGRWSRQLAPRLVSWLRIPAGAHWLDVGCGTGALAHAICAHGEPASVTACDPAEAFVSFARENSEDARASFVIAGAGNLPARAGGYGCVASLLALNFFPDVDAAVREMRVLTVAGGTVAACVWDYADGMAFLRRFWDTVTATDANAQANDEGVRFPLCRPGALTALFEKNGGLRDVRCEPLEITTTFSHFDDYWRPFLGGTGPAPSYVASLSADARARLERALEQSLPRNPDGTIPLTARAWAVRGAVTTQEALR